MWFPPLPPRILQLIGNVPIILWIGFDFIPLCSNSISPGPTLWSMYRSYKALRFNVWKVICLLHYIGDNCWVYRIVVGRVGDTGSNCSLERFSHNLWLSALPLPWFLCYLLSLIPKAFRLSARECHLFLLSLPSAVSQVNFSVTATSFSIIHSCSLFTYSYVVWGCRSLLISWKMKFWFQFLFVVWNAFEKKWKPNHLFSMIWKLEASFCFDKSCNSQWLYHR